jgi:photosystem II stability/assembly factor-like uncharacterized protein
MGSAGGGVWKTTDAGITWSNVSDGYFEAGSMGALEVSELDANVVYAGTGSACLRGNVSTGIGLYKSTDAGSSWEHVGLDDVGQIGRIRVHPRDPDLVYVAALGHAFGPNPERGVYRSTDGGDSWEQVLFVSDSTGAVDLSMDPTNPRVLYASMWRAERKPWTLFSGAMEGGVYKSTDGGDTWTELTNGLPQMTGRIGVSVSPVRPQRVYALVEAWRGEAGLYRSDDGGATWDLINPNGSLIERPWYYNHVFADPQDEHTVYIAGESFWRSVDGGRTFERVQTPHGDNHDLWIHPDDNRVLIEGNDGGAKISYNAGETWSSINNQPTAEFYTLEVDDEFPYRIYGPQQDNSSLALPSRAAGAGITIQRWEAVGGCETGPISVDPRDSNIVYVTCFGDGLRRFDRRTGQVRQIGPYPQASRSLPRELRYPQYVHRSTNEGQSWEEISPDLTRNDVTKQGFAGEPITRDMSGVEVYSTVFEIVESPVDPDALWVGSDDGLIHVSRDRGETWTDVTPPELPAWSTVQTLEGSVHGPGRAFFAAYRYRMDDFGPYVFRTDDYGETWSRLTDGTNGIPADHPVRVVREDPDRKGLLYAGTEFGLFVSFDDGAHWQSLQLNLPHTPVTDLIVHEQDLVVATQGRSFWILDDVTALHQLTPDVAEAAESETHLFEPRPTYRATGFRRAGPQTKYVTDAIGGAQVPRASAGDNPPSGAMIFYSLAEAAESEVTLEVLDAQGRRVRSFSSEAGGGDRLPAEVGLNRFVWDLRYPGVEGEVIQRAGPVAVPGTYQVRLTVGDWTRTASLEVRKDPRLSTTPADFVAQFELLSDIRDRHQEINDIVETLRDVKEQIRSAADRLDEGSGGAQIRERADALTERLTDVEAQIVLVPRGPVMGHQPRMVGGELSFLASYVGSADARPTDQDIERFNELDGWLELRTEAVRSLLQQDLTEFNESIEQLGGARIIVRQRPAP